MKLECRGEDFCPPYYHSSTWGVLVRVEGCRAFGWLENRPHNGRIVRVQVNTDGRIQAIKVVGMVDVIKELADEA
jgi:hypothetical protein